MLSDLDLSGLHSGAREAFAYPAEDGFFLVLEASWDLFFYIFGILEHLFHIFWASYAIMIIRFGGFCRRRR